MSWVVSTRASNCRKLANRSQGSEAGSFRQFTARHGHRLIRACLTGLLDSQAFYFSNPSCMATATKEPVTAPTATKPVQTFRLRGVTVSVFANTAKMKDREVTFHKVAIQRSYRDDDGEWQNTTSYGRDDLPVMGLLLKQAWQWILETEASRGKDESEE